MNARTRPRVLAAMMVAVVGAVALGGCDPVAWMRRPPTASPSPSASTTAVPAGCSGSGAGSVPSASTMPTVPYAALPTASGFSAALEAAAGRVVTVPSGTIAFNNFVSVDGRPSGGVIGPAATGLIGAGEMATVFQLAPNSSTFAAAVPARFPDTNPLYVLRASGDGIVLRDFSVQGTPQGHMYNGIRVDRSIGLRASDLRVVGIPGNAPAPPGETFGINDFKTSGSVWAHITVDGFGLGGSGIGVNSSTDTTICDAQSSNSGSAMGFAFWQSSGIRCIDCTAVDNAYSGFNFERISGSNVLIRPVARGNRYDMRVASDQGSAKITIIDPTLVDGHWAVTLPTMYAGKPNLQRRQDITLILHGKERPDLLRFATQ